MSATNVFENGLLSLIFENANYANVGDATGLRGSSTAGSFYISLHTAYPGLTGVNEVSGGEYVRAAATFTRPVDGRSKMDTEIRYTQMPNAVLTHIGIWTAQRGGMFLWCDALTNPVDVRAGNTFAMAALSVTVVLE